MKTVNLKVELDYPIELEADGSIGEDIYESFTWLVEYFNMKDWSYATRGGHILDLNFVGVPADLLEAVKEEIQHLYDCCEFICT